MRIAYVGPVPPFRGGFAHYGARITEALARAGHEVEVLSWQAPGRIGPRVPREPHGAEHAGARYPLHWGDPRSWRWIGRRARRADALVLPWLDLRQAPSSRTILQAAAGTPAIVPFLREVPGHPAERALTHFTLHRARAFVVHAAAMEERLRTLIPAVPSVVVPHPPSLPAEPQPLPHAPPYRLIVFGTVHRKDLGLMVRAIELLVARGSDVTVTVAGDFGGESGRWRERIGTAGLTGRVEMRAGYVADGSVPPLIAAHHALLAPYRTCSGTGTIALANACGRPVIATGVGALVDDVADGRTGILAPPGDPGAFADAIARALGDLERLARGAAARRDATWERVADAVIGAVS